MDDNEKRNLICFFFIQKPPKQIGQDNNIHMSHPDRIQENRNILKLHDRFGVNFIS